MKKIYLILLMAVSITVIYQLHKPTIREDKAILKAKEYVNVINEKKSTGFHINRVTYCLLDNDTVWNRIIGSRQWTVMVDGVSVEINAYTGEFVRMIFPLDGVITELPK
ncbi:hypothetical protein [Paenibacillus mucilaginosus]|uniref:PepSY domain-containing protein n=1 Tax=Paenibacillus mucilaginosus (strain KNP414) TaxID=1036673 RepID=F8FRG3_PAEMK|nr:hypothetical protein [Paenibacillus mucilaginosus]AEI40520.1 hypothetical protein KNP414_01959 [Paenibacillus mucilaginosus KNP414]MCG7218175.1 hypothetical protein [Paenibacillus mucilaginosus]WDM29689.1 hypothetical protein KCX80_11295 [Paenibacillus mucilaginosus]